MSLDQRMGCLEMFCTHLISNLNKNVCPSFPFHWLAILVHQIFPSCGRSKDKNEFTCFIVSNHAFCGVKGRADEKHKLMSSEKICICVFLYEWMYKTLKIFAAKHMFLFLKKMPHYSCPTLIYFSCKLLALSSGKLRILTLMFSLYYHGQTDSRVVLPSSERNPGNSPQFFLPRAASSLAAQSSSSQVSMKNCSESHRL